MPPSQLKRLKASLREQGVVRPQLSKKQKKQNAQNGANPDKRVQRAAALQGIREQFNPFEVNISSRGPKFDVTSNRVISGRASKNVKARPGVTKAIGEEIRRKTLLVEMQRRNKVGGIMDRRFGEGDTTMAPEEKMLERFTQEKQRRYKNSSVFDLDDDEDQGQLTHMGQSLSLDGPTLADDFDEEGLEISDTENHAPVKEGNPRKRRLSQDEVSENENAALDEVPERKKTKQEVMKEIIAKSKLYKYERQATKDEDEGLREELDKDMQEIHALLQGTPPRRSGLKALGAAGTNPEREALISGIDRTKFEKEYDLRLKQMLQDKKSKPTERTKTNEEKLADEFRRLQELEALRLHRMEGEVDDGDGNAQEERLESSLNEEDGDYGLGSGIKAKGPLPEFGVEDEDDFIIDHDLVASGSDVDISEDETSSTNNGNISGAEDNDFLDGLLTEEEAKRPEFLTGANAPIPITEHPASNGVNGDLAYTFPCPQSHAELLEVTDGVVILDLPTVVRRIRALYNPQLKSENKTKLGKFAVSLVDHISYLANQSPPPPFDVIESLIRHSHSMAKTYPVELANAFRNHLEVLHKTRALEPSMGDLVLLTAIGTIFPTSDHFHQVVTPSILAMARYMGQKIPRNLSAYVVGTYMATLCLEYQRLSKRYIPELVGFLLNTLCSLAPAKLSKVPGCFHYHDSKVPRLDNAKGISVRKLNLIDTRNVDLSPQSEIALKLSLLETSLRVIDTAADFWTRKPAFQEVFGPALGIIQHFSSKSCHSRLPESIQTSASKTLQKLKRLLSHAQMTRRPLELHHHRPLAIKTSIPKFEESFNPDKHYDPDRERAEAAKLRAEHKREKKGAIRELRKDANFIARESLREKKERDAAYEKKYKRLVAEIQGEEGMEAKAYEREKQRRKKGKK